MFDRFFDWLFRNTPKDDLRDYLDNDDFDDDPDDWFEDSPPSLSDLQQINETLKVTNQLLLVIASSQQERVQHLDLKPALSDILVSISEEMAR